MSDERGEGFKVSGAPWGRRAQKMRADAGGTARPDPWACGEPRGMAVHCLQADLQSPDWEGLLHENRHAHGPHGSRLHWALSTVGRASHTSDGTVSGGLLVSSTAESASFPRDGTRSWPTASHRRPRLAFESRDVFDVCGGVLRLHCRASRSLSVEEGAALRLCVRASRGCGSSWGAWALGHVGFSGCWVWAQRSQRPGSRAQIPSARPMGFVAL